MGKVYVVHCIDTEGPLNESLEATFERIYQLTGKRLEPTNTNLQKVQKGVADLGGKEDIAKYVFCERFLSYNRTWQDIEDMLEEITAPEYRLRFSDSEGKGWKFSWFLVDFVDYVVNPRGRDIGYHSVYDHYQAFYQRNHLQGDDFQWHAHPMSVYREANRCDTSYINSPHIWQSLARRLIDRGVFPACFRPGVHTERPDSHWLLEQYIPYDFGNQAIAITEVEMEQRDIAGGRFGDWRRAPATWEPYHPAHDDYQEKGSCRRTIFRCLNVGTRLRCITQQEVDKAFQRAMETEDTILAITDHDFRHMGADIEETYEMILQASRKYPSVKWENATAYEAARKVTHANRTPIRIKAEYQSCDASSVVTIETDLDSFGPQPFFAVKMRGGRYHVANLDFQMPRRIWTYTFDEDTIHPNDVECIGIATNSMEGSGALCVMRPDNQIIMERQW